MPSAAAAVANFLGRAEGARRACLQDAHLQDGRLAARSCAAQGTARNSPLDMTIETAMGTNPSRNGHAVVCVLIGRAAEFAAYLRVVQAPKSFRGSASPACRVVMGLRLLWSHKHNGAGFLSCISFFSIFGYILSFTYL